MDKGIIMFNEDSVNSVYLVPNEYYEYRIKTERRYKEKLGCFTPVGLINHKDNLTKDWLDILLDLPKGSRDTFKLLKRKRCKDLNFVTIPEWAGLTKNKKRPIYQKLSNLKSSDLVLKVTAIDGILPKVDTVTYMINPYVIKPVKYGRACYIWELLGGKAL